MSFDIVAYGAKKAEVSSNIEKVTIKRRAVGDNDVHIKILSASICHSDCHWVNGEWGAVTGVCVPGHEMTGTIQAVGKNVTDKKVGQLVGVGCMVSSGCNDESNKNVCSSCSEHKDERFCSKISKGTYGSPETIDGVTDKTHGGYSTDIVVQSHFACPVPDFYGTPENLKYGPPILCAGITVYTPFKRAGVKAGSKVAVNGIGGLGWFGLRIALAMGAEVYAFTRSESKKADLLAMGCKDVIITTDAAQVGKYARSLDVILDTVSAEHTIDSLLSCVKPKGSYALVGAAPKLTISPFSLIMADINLFGSSIGTIEDTTEVLQLCADHKICIPVETIHPSYINTAYERMIVSDVKYRFSIDIEAMRSEQ